ncbi:MAG: hypothetical protein HY851_12185, partial [candidate division Zixibacteria bacterium]|nr:hypothetical protein [candidate division Zixibacteria bacterium]
MAAITVEKLFQARNQDLELTLLTSSASLGRPIHNAELNRPGLALTGFMERFPNKRIQILGETEMAFVSRIDIARLTEVVTQVVAANVPMIIISKGITPPLEFIQIADQHATPVFSSRLSTSLLVQRLSAYLDHVFAPSTTVHGTLVDVYGVGLLYTGKSGIGKSEVALDLIERGHRL